MGRLLSRHPSSALGRLPISCQLTKAPTDRLRRDNRVSLPDFLSHGPPWRVMPRFVVQGHLVVVFSVSQRVYVPFNARLVAEIRAHNGECAWKHFHGGAMRQSLLLQQAFTFSVIVYWNPKAGKSLGDPPSHPNRCFPPAPGHSDYLKGQRPRSEAEFSSKPGAHPSSSNIFTWYNFVPKKSAPPLPPPRGCKRPKLCKTQKLLINFLDFD